VLDVRWTKKAKMPTATARQTHGKARILPIKKALSKGGANKDGVRVESPSTNRSFKRDSGHKLVSETSKRERKKK